MRFFKKRRLNHVQTQSVSPLDLLPYDCWTVICGFLDPVIDRRNFSLTCRDFLVIGRRIFDPTVNYNAPLFHACSKGYLWVVKLLLQDPRIDPSADDNHAIKVASWKGHWEVVKLLLKDKRVDPSAQSNEALLCASIKGHSKVMELLLKDKRVNPYARRGAAFRYAYEDGHWKVVELLRSWLCK